MSPGDLQRTRQRLNNAIDVYRSIPFRVVPLGRYELNADSTIEAAKQLLVMYDILEDFGLGVVEHQRRWVQWITNIAANRETGKIEGWESESGGVWLTRLRAINHVRQYMEDMSRALGWLVWIYDGRWNRPKGWNVSTLLTGSLIEPDIVSQGRNLAVIMRWAHHSHGANLIVLEKIGPLTQPLVAGHPDARLHIWFTNNHYTTKNFASFTVMKGWIERRTRHDSSWFRAVPTIELEKT